MSMRKIAALLLGIASSGLLVRFPAFAENVGNVGAVNQSAHGTPPGAAKRSLSLGLGVHRRERIETSPQGSAQIVFNDTSTMTVGRNSAVTVDDFAYSGGRGQQGVSLAKGVMRFVGGGVSHEGGTRLRTPTASIAVRGGTAMVRVDSSGTLVVHQYGVTQVGGQTLTQAGYGVIVSKNGQVSEPFLVPPETMAEMIAALESGKKQRGGVKQQPTSERANFMLGGSPPQDVMSSPGLDALGPFWAGNSLVQSRSNVENQPVVTPTFTPTRQDGGGDGTGSEGGGGGLGQ